MAGERQESQRPGNAPVWVGRLAMVFVFVALAALALVPALLQHRLGPVRREAEAADEARELVTRVQFALARQMSALQGAQLHPDTTHLGVYAEAAALERSAYPPLDSLTPALSDSARVALDRLKYVSAAWHDRLDEEAVLRRLYGPTTAALLGRGLAQYELVLRHARDLDAAIAAAAASRRAEIRAAERGQDALTAAMSTAALLAAVLVAWFGQRMRSLARAAAAREADAERALEFALRAGEAREHLVRGITHDLKNPLGAADGYAELLQEGVAGELTAGQSEMLDGIRRCHADTLATIAELLDVSRAEAGTLDVAAEPCDLAALARDAGDEYRGAAAAAGHRFEAVPADEPLTCVTDRHRVSRVLGNLLSNAIKYTPPPGTIVLEARRAGPGEGPGEGRWIELRVRDTGPGIPASEREHIFDEFHRLHGAETRGHGLGLATSRRIARMLGGDITVADAEGGGAAFSIWLPARPAPGGDAGRREPAAGAASPGSTPHP